MDCINHFDFSEEPGTFRNVTDATYSMPLCKILTQKPHIFYPWQLTLRGRASPYHQPCVTLDVRDHQVLPTFAFWFVDLPRRISNTAR